MTVGQKSELYESMQRAIMVWYNPIVAMRKIVKNVCTLIYVLYAISSLPLLPSSIQFP
jgi:hypothetical protein